MGLHFGFLNRKRLEVAGMRPCQSGTDAHMRRARRTPSNSSRHYAPPTACGRAVTQEKSQDLRISGLFFEWLWCLLFYFLFLFFRASSGISGPQDLRAFLSGWCFGFLKFIIFFGGGRTTPPYCDFRGFLVKKLYLTLANPPRKKIKIKYLFANKRRKKVLRS